MGDTAWKAWEREVGKAISRWLTGALSKPRNDLVARQALYGRMIERKYGDMAPHPDCPEAWRPAVAWFMATFHVDAKNRKKFRLPGLLTGKDHEFWSWWAKLSHEAAMAGAKKRLMVLLAKPSGERVLVFGQRERAWFDDHVGDKWGFPHLQLRRVRGEKDGDDETIYLVSLADFLRHADPEVLGCPVAKVGGGQDGTAGSAAGVRPENAGPA